MGKGDIRSKKGKVKNGSWGIKRSKRASKNKPVATAAKKEVTA